MSEGPEVSIIVAAFDEEDTIERCVRRIASVYPTACEILVVDGGHDATRTVVERVAREIRSLRYVRNEGDRGKGHAIRTGCQHARADVMAQIDADLQFLPEELPRLVAPILEGRADVALGSRFMRGSLRRPGSTPALRTLGNKLASGYASLLFFHRMTDVQAGMKAWSADAMKRIAFRSDDYGYEVEIPARALSAGLRVVDVPISTDARQGGKTKVNIVWDGLPLLWDITRFRIGGP